MSQSHFTHPEYPGEMILTCEECGHMVRYPTEEDHPNAIAGEKVVSSDSRLVCIPPDSDTSWIRGSKHKLIQ